RRARRGRAWPHRPSSGRLSVRRAAAPTLDLAPARGTASGLAARRADGGARYRRAGDAGGPDERASRRRRADRRRHPWTDRAAAGRGTQPRDRRVSALRALLLRDMRVAVRLGGGALIGVLFFLTVVTLVPFAIGPDLVLLARIGPAILWIGALLASLLALDRLIAADHEDGSLDLILMARAPLELTLAVKALAHWLTTGLPLVIAAPLLGLLLNLEPKATGAVALTLLVGTPALTFIGLIGAGLTVALRRGGLLLAVLILP